MPVRLVSRPVSAKRRQEVVKREIADALKALGDKSIKELEKQIEKWEETPKFKASVQSGDKVQKLLITVDANSEIGKIFTWVDQGTGERGNVKKSAYKIVPVNAKALKFTAPLPPKTYPYPAQPNFPKKGAPKDIVTQSVTHPGIYPRNFTKVLLNFLKGRHAGSYRNTIEAAVKRAYRKLDKMKES